jgi:hypothetical protein
VVTAQSDGHRTSACNLVHALPKVALHLKPIYEEHTAIAEVHDFPFKASARSGYPESGIEIYKITLRE